MNYDVKTTRRRFLKSLGGTLMALGLPSILTAKKNLADDVPNILFCIADDQSYAHTSIHGCKYVNTPGFDRIANEGILFKHCFISAPSCCPSRGSVLSGQAFYRLEGGAMNHAAWLEGAKVYTDLLQDAGYLVGYTGKGWGPGNAGRSSLTGSGYNSKQNTPPASGISSTDYAANFDDFLNQAAAEEAPFCFWYGCREPHQGLERGSGLRLGKKLEDVDVPSFLPDHDTVKGDLLDYAIEVEWFDEHLQRMIQHLEDKSLLDNTIIVVTSDNGMPIPRAKATCYDWGAHMPLAIRWGAKTNPGRVVDDFVSSTDFAPTFLEAAGLEIPEEMTGKSLMPILLSDESGQIDEDNDHAISGLERHHPAARVNGTTYPIRTYRTKKYLYVKNYAPDRNPVGDPNGYRDTDGCPTKTLIVQNKETYPDIFELGFSKRPAEELYDVELDPDNINNLSADPDYASVLEDLRNKLVSELQETGDPRENGNGELFDYLAYRYSPYYVSINGNDTQLPLSIELKQNYPNPFNPETNIRYSLPTATKVRLDVFDMNGRKITTLVNKFHQAGEYTVKFSAKSLPSGTYTYRLKTSSNVLHRKMVLMK